MGSGVVGFSSLKHGIGLRWLDANTLEIAIPDGVKLDYQRKTSFHPQQGLTYRYRGLRPDDPVYAGCGADGGSDDR